tara:strand:+ start:5991 stop:6641 length:651 start_codon:yes stop_codon:yes gene_type:complete
MAKYRQIHTTFWNDPLILDLTPEQKYFYIYLLTNPNVTQCGIYEISIRQISYHTGYNNDTIKNLLDFFEKLKKIVYSKETNEIAVVNFLKYNGSESPSIKKCIEKDLNAVKNKDLIVCIQSDDTLYTECGGNNKNKKKEEEEEEKKNKKGIDYYNNIAFPNYYDIHYAKRIEQDMDMTKNYHNHLIAIGYEKNRTYDGKIQWKKLNKKQNDKSIYR